MKKYKVKELFAHFKSSSEDIEEVQVSGWVKTNRSSGEVAFIEFNDGSNFLNAQIVYTSELSNFSEVEKFATYSSITVWGKAISTPNGKQPFEIAADNIVLNGNVAEDYPLQKKRHSFEFLREIAHLRPRANTFNAVFRVRSVLSMAIHNFFDSRGFVYVHTPIVTSNDAEGAGEAFTVTTRKDDKYHEDFFGKKAALTVSGQLNAEAFALAFGNVYTFGPTFRAEKSNTTRHVSEFWMIEPEMAYADLADDMAVIEDLVCYCIKEVLAKCPDEMKFFNNMFDNTLLERLNEVASSKFKKLTYTEGIDLLLEAQKQGHKFEYKDIKWGMDLQSEHERYLCEEIVKGPVFLTDYPKDIKAFYMRLNDDQKTVAATDLLVPKIGELVGGSQREERYDYLLKRVNELKMDVSGLEWYLDLRKYGGVVHSGFGVGFDRFLMYLTAIENIRDVIPFPRTPSNLMF